MRSTLTVTALLAGAIVVAAPAAGAPQSCAELGGVVQAGEICRVQASQPAYVMDITFPLDYPDEQAILAYLGQTRDGFVNVASTPDPRNHPFDMDVVSESLTSARTRSVVLTLFQDVGSAHPTTWFKAFNYDTVRGVPVTFDTLFAPGADPMKVIYPIVARELESRTGLQGSISPGDGLDPSRYQNFAITDDSVIFYFGRAELLPSYAGETSVTIPRSSLPALQV
jgi:hypothetical protein